MVLDEQAPSIRAERDGQRVGSIAARVPTLIRCIRAGHAYEAVVDAVDGGAIAVTVRRANN